MPNSVHLYHAYLLLLFIEDARKKKKTTKDEIQKYLNSVLFLATGPTLQVRQR